MDLNSIGNKHIHVLSADPFVRGQLQKPEGGPQRRCILPVMGMAQLVTVLKRLKNQVSAAAFPNTSNDFGL